MERIKERQRSTVSSPTEVLRKDALRESDHWGCSDISRAGAKQGHSWAVPPKRVTVPPTFLLLPSLLNVIDFESESEINKTVHIRKRLRALVSISYCTWLHRLHASHPNLPPLHTQRDYIAKNMRKEHSLNNHWIAVTYLIFCDLRKFCYG